MSTTTSRGQIHADYRVNERDVLARLIASCDLSPETRATISRRGTALVQDIRDGSDPTIMELFLGEYGLSSDEGVALMCLAEALLRVPDTATIDDLIEDKIAPSQWSAHLGQSHSPLINASTWALMLTGRVLDDAGDGLVAGVRGLIKRVGEPLIRTAVSHAMREMGRQFVLGETISTAMERAAGMEAKGFTYSYDMLGEAARTDEDANRYQLAYAGAIAQIATGAASDDIAQNPGISIKLSALHPRYEPLQRAQVCKELAPRVLSLVTLAKSAGIGLNIDAEEADRLDLSLDIIDAVLSDPSLAGWDGFGVVVQAYSKRAGAVIDWLAARAEALDRRIMVRLVKGAYWDTEIKLAQVEGLAGYPVFTNKAATDVSYIACAQKLFDHQARIYPQFATHNAHTAAAILEIAPKGAAFEFQRLHGMGEALHNTILAREGTRCRIYAPVGAHKDLLAYLVRRLLENGANSSFVNQLVDESYAPEEVAADPFEKLEKARASDIPMPADLFMAARANSIGFDTSDPVALAQMLAARDAVTPIWGEGLRGEGSREVHNPATGALIGHTRFATADDATEVLDGLAPWNADAPTRAAILNRAADLYEAAAPELFAVLAQEAGKTLHDCIGELREAVDFLRFYAAEAITLEPTPLGTIACISPWNFPLAIFTGQIAAALAAGNAVLAKPAEATSLIAMRAVAMLHEAGVPHSALALLCGEGAVLGPALCAHDSIAGVAFTGSTQTGQAINRALANRDQTDVRLVAETGGINAMIVDSSALLEQAVDDIIASAFQSAGQRCSALRVLYVQTDIAEALTQMLFGAMDVLRLGDPMDPATDIGPVIDAQAKAKIDGYIAKVAGEGRLLKQIDAPRGGIFVGPAVVSVTSIADVTQEIFGPVLHIATFEADELDGVIEAVNATGFGLTFGLHTRMDARVQHVVDRVDVGNIYVNRNQIGAVVGVQPFGGHGLSGTGPKAGGPRYLSAFSKTTVPRKLDSPQQLRGPTGEENTYAIHPRAHVLCTGPGQSHAAEQARVAESFGCKDVVIAPDATPRDVETARELSVVIRWDDVTPAWRKALAAREGQIARLATTRDLKSDLTVEHVVCIDTTAAGGNADLLAREA